MPSVERSFGGPTQALVEYLHAGRRAGIEGDVVSVDCSAEDRAAFAEATAPGRLTTFSVAGVRPLERSRSLERYIRDRAGDYDVVHVHGLLNLVSSLGARAARAAARPVVIRPFGTLSRYTFAHRRGALKRAYFAALDVPLLRSAEAIHFTTEEERDESAWHGLELTARSWVIPPPVRPVPGPGRPARPASVVLFLGRLHPKKGLDSLLDAWPAVRRSRPGASLVLAGSGDPKYEAALKARVMQDGGGTEGVRFAGFVTGAAKRRLLADADVFVLPSFQENFGVAVLEAVASGLPVVVTPEVQLASWIQAHELGRVTGRAPLELARSIVQALNDEAMRRRCAERGARLVERHFSPETVGAALEAMYASVVGTPVAGAVRV